MACSSGCPTQDHANWGECVRDKNLQLNGLESLGGNRTAQKAQDRELALYGEARAAGLQTKSTSASDSLAVLESNG